MRRQPVFADTPVVVGHRGLGKGVVDGHEENSLASFEAALAAGATWLETDVRACADGTLVLAHHPTLPDGRFLSDLPGAEAGAAGIATLDDLLDWVPDGAGLNLELKTSLEDATKPPAQTTAGVFATRIPEIRHTHQLLVTSFDPSALLIVRERVPDVPVGLVGWVAYPLRKVIPAAAHLGCDVVVAHTASFRVNTTDSAPVHHEASVAVGVAHEAGLQVVAWCPAPKDAPTLAGAGVDALVVNDVAGVHAALAASAGQARPRP